MKLQEQVITLEQAKRMFELGIHLNSQFAWCWNGTYMDGSDKGFFINLDGFKEEWPEAYCAYTVAELGVMLPDEFKYKWSNCFVQFFRIEKAFYSQIRTIFNSSELFNSIADTEATSRGALLIHLLETGTISSEQCNAALSHPHNIKQ